VSLVLLNGNSIQKAYDEAHDLPTEGKAATTGVGGDQTDTGKLIASACQNDLDTSSAARQSVQVLL